MANNTIALGIRAPEMPDPIAQQNSSLQYATNLMAIRKQAKLQNDEDTVRAAYSNPANLNADGTTNYMSLAKSLAGAGRGDLVPSINKQRLEEETAGLNNKKTTADIGKVGADTQTAQFDLATKVHDDVMKRLATSDTPELAMAQAARLKQLYPQMAGELDQTMATMPPPGSDPTAYNSWHNKQLRSALSAKEQLQRVRTNVNAGDRTVMTSTPEFGDGPVETTGVVTNGVSQDTRYATDHQIGQPFQTTDAQGVTHTYLQRPDGTAGEVGTDSNGNMYAGTTPLSRSGPGGGGQNPYDVVLGNGAYGQPKTPVSQMSMGEAYDFGRSTLIPNTRGKVGAGSKGSSAVGAYQIVGSTMQAYAQKMFGADWRNVKFTPQVQDQMAQAIYTDAQRSGTDMSKVWTSLSPAQASAMRNMPWSQARDIISQGESGAPASKFMNAGQTREQLGITPVGGKPSAAANRQIRSAKDEDKFRKTASVDMSAVSTMADQTQAMRDVATRLLKTPDDVIGSLLGYGSWTPDFFRGKAGKTASADMQALQSQVETFGRNLAVAQGGKLGNMAVQEWQKVGGAVAMLKAGTLTPDKFRDVIRGIINRTNEADANTRDAYIGAYGPDIASGKYNRLIPKGMTIADFADPSDSSGGSVGGASHPDPQVDALLKKYGG